MLSQWATQHMGVIGHDGVGEHLAAGAFKMLKGLDQGLLVVGMAQEAFATTFVENQFQLPHLHLLKLLPPGPFLRRQFALMAVGSLSFRVTRTSRMVSQYGWLYERSSPVSWKQRDPANR